MNFYGYSPIPKDYRGIGAAIGQLGAGLGAGIQEAVNAAQNWEDMENAIKGIRTNYTNYGKVLIDKGAITQEMFQLGFDQLRMPTRADKKNPEAYIREMQTKVANAYKIFAGKEDLLLKEQRQQQIGQIGQQALSEQRGLRTTGYQPTETTQTGFQKYEPVMEEQVTEPAPATREEAVSRFAAGTEEVAPTPKEVTGFEKGVGQQLPTRQQQLAERKEERVTAKEKALSDQQTFNNEQRRKNTALRAASNVLQMKKFKISGLTTQKKDLVSDMNDTTEQIETLNKAIEQEKGKHKTLRNQQWLDELEDRLKTLEETKKQQKQLRDKFTSEIAKLSGAAGIEEESPETDFAAKFPNASPEEIKMLQRLSNSINPETGKQWTIDELLNKWNTLKGAGTEQSPPSTSLGESGYPFGGR